jgi:protein involved in polysaccharide export with SLBB domain
MIIRGMRQKLLHKTFRFATTTLGLLATVWFVAGCGPLVNSNDGGGSFIPPRAGNSSDTLRAGDLVTVIFSDLPTPTLPFEERIKDDGTITLLLNQTFQAAGKNRGDLEREIRTRYVPRYYLNLTVTVKPQERFYYVEGEVKMPSRQPHPGDITVLKAIATAQGFTDYANKRKVRLVRAGGQTIIVDCVAVLDNSQLDLPVYPNDKIHVPRRLW